MLARSFRPHLPRKRGKLVRVSRTKPPSNLTFYGPEQWRARFARLADAPWMPLELPGIPHNVTICFGEAADGRLIVTGLLIDPSENIEITSRLLREIRLGEIAARADASPFPIGRVKRSAPYRIRKSAPKDWPVELERFAAAYKRALHTHRRTPVLRVMVELGMSEATAHRWLQRARAVGLLDQRPTKGKQS
jgi:hypothetical protein